MTEQDIITRIQSALVTLKLEEADLNRKYKKIFHFSEGSFKLLPELERVRKRRVELENALRVMSGFE